MDAFDYQDDIRPARSPASLVWNIITGLMLLTVVCVTGAFLAIFFNPQIGINPFPPPTIPALAEFPTPTPTARNVLPPTWTPTVSPVSTGTETPAPTPSPTEAPTEEPAAEETAADTPIAQDTPVGGMPYSIQQGDPVSIPNIGHPDLGCNWTGIAGQATGLNGAPVVGLFVQLGGSLQGQNLDKLSMTGTATQYGSAGYELSLGNDPVASSGTLWVQLFDQAMLPLSEKIFFDTFADCDENLILVNFRQVR
ncbi:MAG TPA: hypothetical protein VIK64_04335 [Anaerolineales bacterium]